MYFNREIEVLRIDKDEHMDPGDADPESVREWRIGGPPKTWLRYHVENQIPTQ